MATKRVDRRAFLKKSAVGAATGAAVSLIGTQALGANDKLNVGFIGLGGRGKQLMGHVLRRKDTQAAYVCDLDTRRHATGAKLLAKLGSANAKIVTDYRQMLDDKALDVLINATPDQWHCLPVIHACQAGKDAYVEKPLSHNIWEGRQTVKAARKYKRIVQVGIQNRSAPYCILGRDYIREGKLGKLHFVRVCNLKNRGRIDPKPDCDPPKGVDYDLWLGPAPKRPFNPNNFHYKWHWFWDFSGGDIINDAVHQIDLARMLIDKTAPQSVVCTGGKFAFAGDVQDTPDTQCAHWQFPDMTMTFDLTLWTPYIRKTPWGFRNTDNFPNWMFNATRIELYGEKGMMIMGRHGGGWQAFGPDGKIIAQQPGRRPSDDHFDNFFECIRSRKLPNADVEEGHLSTNLCHLANISYRVGGRRLTWDAAKEQFVGDPEANKLTKRIGRAPYQIPEEV